MSTPIPITPTIGRKVWLFIEQGERRSHLLGVAVRNYDTPLDASIAYVHPRTPGEKFTRVTVTFADHDGIIWHTTVPLRQANDPVPDAREWVEWMPYQAGQAAKQAATTGENTPKKPRRVSDPRRMLAWLLAGIVLYLLAAVVGQGAPAVQTVLYKLGHVTTLSWVGYWIARQGIGRLTTASAPVDRLARAVVIAGVVIAGSLGL